MTHVGSLLLIGIDFCSLCLIVAHCTPNSFVWLIVAYCESEWFIKTYCKSIWLFGDHCDSMWQWQWFGLILPRCCYLCLIVTYSRLMWYIGALYASLLSILIHFGLFWVNIDYYRPIYCGSWCSVWLTMTYSS